MYRFTVKILVLVLICSLVIRALTNVCLAGNRIPMTKCTCAVTESYIRAAKCTHGTNIDNVFERTIFSLAEGSQDRNTDDVSDSIQIPSTNTISLHAHKLRY